MCCEAQRPIYGVVGLGTKRDLMRETTQIVPVDNPWHVRHCMNCRCHLNRDFNSAPSMILLLEGELNGITLPDCFSRECGKIAWRENLE